jgi:hypothetical protein
MGTGHAHVGGFDLVPAHPLGGVDRVADAADRFLHVDDHAATEAVRGRFADPDDVETALGRLADHAADLGCADV